MPTRNVNLTEHQDAFVGAALASGRYQNASEVVREALRLLEDRESQRLAYLRAAVAEAENELADGNFIELEIGELDAWLSGLGQKSPA